MIHRYLFIVFLLVAANTFAQKPILDNWRAAIHREDGNDIIFNFHIQNMPGKKLMFITNGSEMIKIDHIHFVRDSVFIEMPVFESTLKAAVSNDSWDGVWVKGTSAALQTLHFTAEKNKPRFTITDGPAKYNMSGRWAVNFSSDHQSSPMSIAEFKQQGNKLTGTFLTATGDYRFQEGIVTGNKFMLSGFDGAHAFLFTGTLADNKTIKEANYYSGVKSTETWSAVKDPKRTHNYTGMY